VLTTFRSLALLASHPQQASAARKEIDARSGPEMDQMPYLRATVLESLRLWPTPPLILRDTTHATSWRNGIMRPNTGLVIFTPFFTAMLAELLKATQLRLKSSTRLIAGEPLPATLNHFRLRFEFS
jgi:cytochrome P450